MHLNGSPCIRGANRRVSLEVAVVELFAIVEAEGGEVPVFKAPMEPAAAVDDVAVCDVADASRGAARSLDSSHALLHEVVLRGSMAADDGQRRVAGPIEPVLAGPDEGLHPLQAEAVFREVHVARARTRLMKAVFEQRLGPAARVEPTPGVEAAVDEHPSPPSRFDDRIGRQVFDPFQHLAIPPCASLLAKHRAQRGAVGVPEIGMVKAAEHAPDQRHVAFFHRASQKRGEEVFMVPEQEMHAFRRLAHRIFEHAHRARPPVDDIAEHVDLVVRSRGDLVEQPEELLRMPMYVAYAISRHYRPLLHCECMRASKAGGRWSQTQSKKAAAP